MTGQQQRMALGISATAYEGLVLLEIEGPPVVTLTPREARRFYLFFERAYRDALTRDRNRKAEVQ